MTLTLNVLVALLIALGLSVGLFLLRGRHEARAAGALESAEAALATVRSLSEREKANATAKGWEASLAPVLRVLSMRKGTVEAALIRATAIRLSLSQRLFPVATLLLLLGGGAGFLHRERARELVLYSSVTFSYLGKFLALSAVAFCTFVALSPFAPPLWTLYPALGAAATGTAIYVGNLPPKL